MKAPRRKVGQVISNEPLFQQIWDVATEIGGDIRHGNFEPFVNAHSLSRGAGYMAGGCPGVCQTDGISCAIVQIPTATKYMAGIANSGNPYTSKTMS